MKKFAFFVPVLIFLLFTTVGMRIFASGTVSPSVLLIMLPVALLMLMLVKPKSKGSKPASNLEQKARGEFARDAFANNPKLEALFLSAVKDYNSNMPKAALSKLTKLAQQCTEAKDIYAVSMATAQCHLVVGKPLPAIREYTRALNLYASPEVALELGSCHQRLGNLDKARDSYEFALDLDPDCLEAYSRIATTYVADHQFQTALDYANKVLDKDEHHASSLATAAICHGLLDNPVMSQYYTQQAVDHGYSQKKIEETISTLKRRV